MQITSMPSLRNLHLSSPPVRSQTLAKETHSICAEAVTLSQAAQITAPRSKVNLTESFAAALGLCLVGTGLLGAEAMIAQTGVEQQDLSVLEIPPGLTDPDISQVRGPHVALIDPQVEPNGLLLLSLGGTNSLPRDLVPFDQVAAREGYATLGLDYPNTVITTACRNSEQPDPCTLFRREIVSGEAVSDLVEVDAINSIEHRIESLLRYQAEQDPERYGEFMSESGPAWEKIVLVGHSQGSGHAGFLAKKHPVKAVILLAGPQDTTDAGPASWMTSPGATSPERYYSFLHRDDFFGSETQLEAARLLRQEPDAQPSSDGRGPIIMTHNEVRDPHMSVITAQFSDLWQGLLQRAAQTP